jgi:hypothetical protein
MWVVKATPQPLYARERDPVRIVQEAGWDLGTVWTSAKCLSPTGNRSRERPARSESLYRLRYPGPLSNYISLVKPYQSYKNPDYRDGVGV